MKNRLQHYNENCNYFKFFECRATICKIKQNKTCPCKICKHHDCYDLNSHAFDADFDESGNTKQ